MNHYHTSVQGVCLLKKLNLPDIAINLIRRYVNFAVDITGYSKRDLLGYLKKENNVNIFGAISRSKVINYLHRLNIIIYPIKKKEDKYEKICKLFINEYLVEEDKIIINLKNGKTLEWKFQNGFINVYTQNYTVCIINIKKINNNRIKCTVLILTNNIITEYIHVNSTMYIWSFLFLLFSKFMNHIRSSLIEMEREYMKILRKYNYNENELILSCLEYIYHGVEIMNKYKLNYAYTKRPPITYIRMNVYVSYFFLEDIKRDVEILDALST